MTCRALVVLLALVASACGHQVGSVRHVVDNARHVDGIKNTVASSPAWVDGDRLGGTLWTIERAFYEKRQYLPAWIDGDRPTPQLKDLIRQLHDSEQHGLEPARYRVGEFEQVIIPVERVPELDAKMTYAYLRYAADLLGWSSSPQQVDPNWLDDPKQDDLAGRLEEAVDSSRVRQTLEELAPTHPQYKGLQSALASERVHSTGHLEQILMNLERWRWAPRDLGDRYILVNVPAYQLQVMEGEKPALAMRVIVGRPQTRTPLFSDEMTYVVFSPYWNIPSSILRHETLPQVAKDPDYLARNNIEVVGTSGGEVIDPEGIDWSDASEMKGLRLRQVPGDGNALGLVKFVFPNPFDVYLHDTPSRGFFLRAQRALSHGCIRVENPLALAEYLLGDQTQWTGERISAAMHAGTEQAVTLKKKLPVHIGYWTAWVEPDGSVTYTADPYGFDKIHARLRAAGSVRS